MALGPKRKILALAMYISFFWVSISFTLGPVFQWNIGLKLNILGGYDDLYSRDKFVYHGKSKQHKVIKELVVLMILYSSKCVFLCRLCMPNSLRIFPRQFLY